MKPTPNILEEQNLALSFCGCGFLGVYHLGSAVCFKRHGPSLLKRFSRTGGASAGSLVSALLVCNDSKLIECYHDILELANIVRNLKYGLLTPGFSLHKHLRMLIEKYISDDSHSKADGKVFISVSNFTSLTNKLISQYRSKEDLVNSLLASCYIPFFSGIWEKPPVIDGTQCVDGGLTLNLPTFHDFRTVTVSPFHGEADIAPADKNVVFDWKFSMGKQRINVSYNNIVRGKQALIPPSEKLLREYFDRGIIDTITFLKKVGAFERPEGTPV